MLIVQGSTTRFVCSLDGAAWPLVEYDGVSIQRCVEIGNGVGVERVEEEDTIESLKAAMFLAGDENSIESPIFWSVYLRHAGTGESESIADLETKEQALALRKALCLIIGCAEDDE